MMISIRKLTLEDATTTFKYSSDFENTYYMLNSPFSSIDETKEFLSRQIDEYESDNPRHLSFAIIYNDIHVGEVFASILLEEAIIGWIIDKNYWGNGIATSAAKMLIDYLQNEYGIKDIIAYCDERNIASRRVMEKIGMEFVGENGMRHYEKNVSPGRELKFKIVRKKNGL